MSPGETESEPKAAADPVEARELFWEGFVRRMARVERLREEHRVLLLGSPGARAAVFWAQEFRCHVRVVDGDAGVGGALDREAAARGCTEQVEFRQGDPLAVAELGLESEAFSVIYAHGLAEARGFAKAASALRPYLEPDGLGILRHQSDGRIKETIALFPKSGYEPITCELVVPGTLAPASSERKREGWFVGRRVDPSGPPRWPRRRSSE